MHWPWMLFLIFLATPARAQYRRSGLLNWKFDDITVKTAEGTRRSAGFAQSYAFSMGGPLFTPLLGEGDASVNFSQGKSLTQAVAAENANQKTLGYSFHARLLPLGLRRYMTLNPSFSRTNTQQAALNLVDTSKALTVGLALPRLPSVSASRSLLSRRDAAARPSVNQDTQVQTEQSAYTKGPLRLNVRRDRSRTDDRLSTLSSVRTEQKRADAELDIAEMKGRVERVSLRASYQDQGTESSGAASRQDSKTASVYLATRRFKARPWESFLGYGGDYSWSSVERRDSKRNSLTLTSFAPLSRGRVDNRLTYQRADGLGAQQSASDSATGEWSTRSGKTALRASADGSWSQNPLGGAVLSDGLRQRLTFSPRPFYDFYGEAATSGASPVRRGAGGSRQHSLGSGLGLHPAAGTDLSGNYIFTRSRNFSDGAVNSNHSLTASLQSAPMEGLKTSANYSLTWSRSSAGFSSRGETLSLSADYAPAEGVLLSGTMMRGGRALNAIFNGSYTLGRTQVAVRYERQELYTVNTYSHWSLSLSRFL